MELSAAILRPIVRRALDQPDAEPDGWTVTPASHRVENMTTHALDRVQGTSADGTPWSVFAKTLHPASASPIFEIIPDDHRLSVLENLNWLDEPRVYRSALRSGIVDGFRMPRVLQVDEGEEQIVLWLEDVADHGAWDLDRYHRSARALGQMAGRWDAERVDRELGFGRRSLEYLFFGKVSSYDLQILADDATWADEALARAAGPDLRSELSWLASALPPLVLREPNLPHALSHGDASPANLLAPGDGSMVAIDWSYGCKGPIGADLAQLIAGRFDTGEAGADELPAIAECAFDGYLAGLADEGVEVSEAAVVEACTTHLAVRAAFTAPLIDRSDLTVDERADLLQRRCAITRHAAEMARSVLANAG